MAFSLFSQRRKQYARNRRFQSETLECRSMLAGDLVISEFMADNSATLADEDGDYPDWIEIYNPSQDDVSLSGWHLTDDVIDAEQVELSRC